jgi:hypothetical protein
VYLINSEQARGLDFPTTYEIEQNGGNYLLLGILPSSYLAYHQALGRTGRIGNKGQYSVILYDVKANNRSGELYLSTKQMELQNSDILLLNQLNINLGKSKLSSNQHLS